MIKPILFNTEMVRAIQNGTKTATRRVVKGANAEWLFIGLDDDMVDTATKNGVEIEKELPGLYLALEGLRGEYKTFKSPYRPGDILYVRETWGLYHQEPGFYVYKADKHEGTEFDGFKWNPSIHMPREAARIFLRVTDVKVQRVRDITEEEARKEGCKDRGDFHRIWDYCYSEPLPVMIEGAIDHYESYPWEDIQETRTYRGKPWYVIGNPWVWVIEFERCEKPEESA